MDAVTPGSQRSAKRGERAFVVRCELSPRKGVTGHELIREAAELMSVAGYCFP